MKRRNFLTAGVIATISTGFSGCLTRFSQLTNDDPDLIIENTDQSGYNIWYRFKNKENEKPILEDTFELGPGEEIERQNAVSVPSSGLLLEIKLKDQGKETHDLGVGRYDIIHILIEDSKTDAMTEYVET